jgi:hypothetical protein
LSSPESGEVAATSREQPVKTVRVSGMKESYSEGIANHTGLGSYAGVRKDEGGTLIEVHAGRALSREMSLENQGADAVLGSGRRNRLQRKLTVQKDPARSETPGMHGNILNGDWEIPRLPVKAGRIGKSKDARR